MSLLDKLHNSNTADTTRRVKFEIAEREKEAEDAYLRRLEMLQKFTLKHVQNTPTKEVSLAYVGSDEFHIPQLETSSED